MYDEDDEEEEVSIEDLIVPNISVSKRCVDCKKVWLVAADIVECLRCGGRLRPIAAEVAFPHLVR